MRGLLTITRPAVWFLGISTNAILKLLRTGPDPSTNVSEEEIRILIRQGMQVGVFEKSETEMVERVFQLPDRRVSSMMTPRPEIEWLDINDSPDANRDKVMKSAHSCFPVGKQRLSNFHGILTVKHLLHDCMDGKAFEIPTNLNHPLFVPETMRALQVLELFRKQKTKLAMVIDEYGAIIGLVTLHDILQAIAGDFPEADTTEEPIVLRDDGSWLVDAMTAIEDLRYPLTEYAVFAEEGDYSTLAGYILHKLGRIPKAGDHFESGGLRFEVVDMDGKRIDKVLVSPVVHKPAP